MRKSLRYVSVMTGFFLLTQLTQAQNDRFAFAITDLQQTGSGWNALRRLDLKTGQYSDVLLNGTDAALTVFDAITKKPFIQPADARIAANTNAPFTTGVAAMAYDKRNNRLYFTPMFIDQLRYVDLKTMKVYYVTDQRFTTFGNHNDEGKIITRMVIAPDGNGYAITNDATSFIKFSTGKKLQVTRLGSLVDDPANGGASIHNRCSSWGGDLVADDEGSLYIFSSRNSIYKVNPETKVAKLLGYIKGLPQDFTTNGAVVDDEGSVLVSSAVNKTAYYVVNTKNWTASPFPLAVGVFPSSDLANSNYLQTKPRISRTETIREPENLTPSKIMIYPNPVSNNQFSLQFGKLEAGNYRVELTDVMGRVVMRRMINVQAEDQLENFSLKPSTAKGIYLVNIIDANKKSAASQKIVVQ